ncbi:GntR family transcriptional regulator [Arthrobacter oryzae]|uniref:DNA-binding GntR family transcriptional regulator n=1 Tax=Arthrobacter oryzae TaxID=409290 RepID=A0A495EA25_9MICC|nr:GntR family transcriptional regulator [Arthrobacter oryzae]RKR13772.1 DNA-binding GntR family transcriptional regulator [Arthrobacter oryzae]
MSPRRREAPPGPTEAARLADDLRDRILSGELAAGTPLREQAIASDEGLSRHTVRTALALLSAERLVIQEPYRGIRVTSFTAEDVRGLQELRCALEAEAVRLACARYGQSWPDEVTAPVRAAMAELESTAREHARNWPVVAAAHAGVHRAIVAAANSPRLQEAYARLDSEMLLLLVNLRPNYSAEEVANDHRDYLRQIQADGEGAVRRHLDHGTQQISPRSSR